MDDVMLEQLVERSAARTVYPAAPALRGRVVAAISLPAPSRERRDRRTVFAAAALALVALAAGVTLAVPSSRSAVADFFGVEGTNVERLPTSAPDVTPTPLPKPEDPASIATPVSLAEAQAQIGFAPALPAGAGKPLAVYVKTYGDADTVVILRFAEFDLWEARPREIFFGKGLPEGVLRRDTTVGGHPAFWIEGGPHIVYLFGESGTLPGSERTVARDTLVWRTDFALYRLETSLTPDEATRLAATLP